MQTETRKVNPFLNTSVSNAPNAKVYQADVSPASFRCANCGNLVSAGEACFRIVHPKRDEFGDLILTFICDTCPHGE